MKKIISTIYVFLLHTYRKLRFIIKILLNKEVLYFPQVKINTKFIGSEKYGGWTIHPNNLTSNSIIYSFGIGEDINFDLEIITAYNCSLYAFDPTPKSICWIKKQTLPNNFHFYKFGIEKNDGKTTFYPPNNPTHVSHSIIPKNKKVDNNGITVPVYTLKTIMNKLGHKKINILKMDIEGSEYNVIKNILQNNIPINQILIEFHHRLPGISTSATKNAIKMLNNYGYKIFSISPNKEEYSFIKI